MEIRKGNYVKIISPVDKYKDVTVGMVGRIDYPVGEHISDSYKVGLWLPAVGPNRRSGEGLYWIPKNCLEVITVEVFLTMAKNKGKEENYMPTYNNVDCNDRERGLRSASEGRPVAKNSEVVRLYFSRKESELHTRKQERTDEAIANDPNVIELKAVVDKIKESDTTMCRPATSFSSYVTKETSEEIRKIANDHDEEVYKLNDSRQEITALLSGCSSYAEELEILKGYGIVKIQPDGITM